MSSYKSWSALGLACALLAACGGGGSDMTAPGSTPLVGAPTTKGAFTAVVSFGDSLSDVGTYQPATVIPGSSPAMYLGGKFTTNFVNPALGGSIWVENVATALNIPLTAAEMGFNGQSVKCPAAANPALANSCTAYGQGGARVTDPMGIGRTADGKGSLTVPVKTQIENHLKRFGQFKASDLIVVYGGNNDVLVQFMAFGAKAGKIQADAAAGKLTADQAKEALLNAQLEGQGELKLAAQQLAGYIKDSILAKGGKYVVVENLGDIGVTPLGLSQSAAARGVLSGFSEIFNLWLKDSLANQPVQWVDNFSFFRELSANPSKYGLTNVTTPTCSAAAISVITGGLVTDGTSLFCNATPGVPFNGMASGASATTWAFADAVHPSTGGHKVLSDEFLRLLKSWGWI